MINNRGISILYMACTDRSLAKESYFNLKGKNTIYYLKRQILKRKREMRDKLIYNKEQPVYLKLIGRTIDAVYESQIAEMLEKNITHDIVEPINLS